MTAATQPSGGGPTHAATAESGPRLCPFCAEAVRPAAKICPHCQSRLGRFAVLRSELTRAIPALLCLGVILGLSGRFEQRLRVEGRPFAPHRQDLVVQGIQLSRPGGQSRAVLTGVVTNRGHHPWRVRAFEVRFLNPDGTWLEVQHPKPAEPFVVQPGQAAAFRVTLDSALPESVQRAPLEVRVQQATDGTRNAAP